MICSDFSLLLYESLLLLVDNIFKKGQKQGDHLGSLFTNLGKVDGLYQGGSSGDNGEE